MDYIRFGNKKIQKACQNIKKKDSPAPVSVSNFKLDVIKYKALENTQDITTIVLGSSHGRDGFIPEIDDFNLANSSQDLYRAYKIYEYVLNQKDKYKSLKNVVLFWSVFHPGLQLEKTREYLKCIPYKVFYNIEYAVDFPISDEEYVKQLKNLYKQTNVNEDYRGKSLWDVPHNDKTSQLVEKHLKNTKRNNHQIQYVEKMLNLALENNHKLYIVLPPYRKDYLDCLPQDNIVYLELFDFLSNNKDVKLLNFQRNTDFQEDDFNSADHCNEKGAKKLTKKIKAILKEK